MYPFSNSNSCLLSSEAPDDELRNYLRDLISYLDFISCIDLKEPLSFIKVAPSPHARKVLNEMVNELLLKVKEYHVDDVIERMFELGSCMIMKLSLPLSQKVDGDMSAYLNNYLRFIYTSKKEDLGMFFAAQTGDKESYFKILKKKTKRNHDRIVKGLP